MNKLILLENWLWVIYQDSFLKKNYIYTCTNDRLWLHDFVKELKGINQECMYYVYTLCLLCVFMHSCVYIMFSCVCFMLSCINVSTLCLYALRYILHKSFRSSCIWIYALYLMESKNWSPIFDFFHPLSHLCYVYWSLTFVYF